MQESDKQGNRQIALFKIRKTTKYRYIVECETCGEASLTKTVKELELWTFEHMGKNKTHYNYFRFDNWRDCYKSIREIRKQ